MSITIAGGSVGSGGLALLLILGGSVGRGCRSRIVFAVPIWAGSGILDKKVIELGRRPKSACFSVQFHLPNYLFTGLTEECTSPKLAVVKRTKRSGQQLGMLLRKELQSLLS
ncbi:hypothetical protein F5Y04DRAFT_266435 [Hypomontagnella monticulosa]|nr:hypothetical protein F5Y04DRAFT_266435 [Hypomontagnella monticulosa]